MISSTALPAYALDLGGGVVRVDTGLLRPGFDAAYLVVDDGRAAFIDTGPTPGVARLLATLDALGVARDAVDWIIPTHVHLDHAGGVGALAQALPAARVLVHPRGARHLIDPSRLYAGALAIYGQAEMDRSYGQLVPVPAERVHTSEDGQTLDWAGGRLSLADTPGHARHHHCIWDAHTRGWFVGDTFGLSYREFDTAQGPWILPTTTPVQFEPQALKASVRRLLAADPACMYLTHFSRVEQVQRLGAQLLTMIDAMVAIAQAAPTGAARHGALRAALGLAYVDGLHRHGCTQPAAWLREHLELDIELNAQGLGIWLDKTAATGAGSAG